MAAMKFNAEEFEKLSATGIIQYFEQSALASYVQQPEKYTVETDYFEGKVSTTDQHFRDLEATDKTDEYINVRFGYRTLITGELARAVWIPDLVEGSKSHVARWAGFHLKQPQWTDEDERFASWVRRYIEGDWGVDNGPGHYLGVAIHVINAITEESISKPLFRHELKKPPSFPSADNTHRYEDAHKDLYGYLIDGLDKEAIGALARQLQRPTKVENMNTRTALEAVLPALKGATDFQKGYDIVSDARRRASHGVRAPAVKYNAFGQFAEDLRICVSGLKQLIEILERELGLDAQIATARFDAKRYLPKITAPAETHYSINRASDLVGKTVERVEFGSRRHIEGVHESEALIIYFTDGSILGIDTGSNVGNLKENHESLKAADFHVDFFLQWVPPKK